MFSSPISSREPSTRPLKCRCRPASLLPLLLTVLPVASAAWWDHRLPWLDRCRDEREVKRALALTDCEHDRHDFYRLLRLRRGERKASKLRAARKKLLLRLHPDKNRHPQAGEAFHAAQQAYEVLTQGPGGNADDDDSSSYYSGDAQCPGPCECDRSGHQRSLRRRDEEAKRKGAARREKWTDWAEVAWRRKKVVGLGLFLAYTAVGVVCAGRVPPDPMGVGGVGGPRAPAAAAAAAQAFQTPSPQRQQPPAPQQQQQQQYPDYQYQQRPY